MSCDDPDQIALHRLQAQRARDPLAHIAATNAQTRRAAMEREDQRHRQKALGLPVSPRPWWFPLRRILPF